MGLNVLVVDDSSVTRAMIVKTLRLSGLPVEQVHQAANGAEGLKLLEEAPVDLALVDLNMPVMTGEEMIERLRADPQTADLPVVVVSTEGSFTRIALLRKMGAEFVHKPFTPEALREMVAEVTGVTHERGADQGAVPGGGPDF